MTEHKIGTREEWNAARQELLERENGHAQRSEELAQHDGRSQLLAYNLNFVVPYYNQLLDRTPKGRVDEFQATRRDEYE